MQTEPGLMNIVFIWTSPFLNGGGVGSATAKLAAALRQKGYGVNFLSLGFGKEYEKDGITQFFLSADKKISVPEKILRLRAFLEKHATNILINQSGIDRNVMRIIKKSNTGGVKVFSVHHNCISCLQHQFSHIIKGNSRDKFYYPLINNRLGISFLKLKSKLKYRRYFEYAIANSDRLVLLSPSFIPELKTYLKHPPAQKISAIPNPASFDVAADTEPKKKNRLLYVGRIEYVQKQVNLLLDIWKKISVKHTDWHFDIVGKGAALNELKQRAESDKLQNLQFHGQMNPVIFFEQAKFFLMVSAFEGFPMVLVEAQAYGTVPFSFDSFSALSDIVHPGVSGMMIEPFDINKYSEALADLMGDENKRRQMAASCQQSMMKFNAATIAGRWIDLFDEVSRN